MDLVAATAGVTTALTLRMALCTCITAIRLILHHNRIFEIHNAQAIGTSTFHLRNSCHGILLGTDVGWTPIIISEYMFICYSLLYL